MGQPVDHDCPAEAEAREPSQRTRDMVSELMLFAEAHAAEDYPHPHSYAYRFEDVGCPEHLLELRAFKGTSEYTLTVVDLAGRAPGDRAADEGPFLVKHDASDPVPEREPENARGRPWWRFSTAKKGKR